MAERVGPFNREYEMRKLTILLAVALFQPVGALAQSPSDVDLTPLFADVYDSPVVQVYETGIQGLLRCGTFDSSHLREDPLIARCWLVTNQTQRFRCDVDGLREAFSVLAFAPSSNEEAVTVIQMFTPRLFDEYVLADSTAVEFWDLPAEIETSIEGPVVSQDGDIYTVSVFTYWVNNSWRWHYVATQKVLSFRTFEIGPGHLTMTASELWSETDRDAGSFDREIIGE